MPNVENRSPAPFIDGVLILLICVLAALPRLLVLLLTQFGIESDEAIIGLMAKHINEGRSWPIFYYGQPYMGSLEAILVAGMFRLIGQSEMAIKLVPLLFSILHIALVYALGCELSGKRMARIAAFLTAFAPSILIIWSSKARGGFIELVVLGTLVLLLSVRVIRHPDYRRTSNYLMLGVVCGLGWWVNNQMLFYLVAVACVGLYLFLKRAWPDAPSGLARAKRSALFGGFVGVGFLFGGAPFWYVNLFERPYLQTFKRLGTAASWDQTVQHFYGFFQAALPIIFGASRPWSDTEPVFPYAVVLGYVVYGVVFGVLLFRTLRGMFRANDDNFSIHASWLLLLIFVGAMPAIFSRSAMGWLSQEPRYLLPIYSVLFLFVAEFIEMLRSPGSFGFVRAVFAGAITLSVLSLNLGSNYFGGEVALPDQPFVAKGERVDRNHGPLIDWLQREGYRHIWANYWIGYRLAFETNERITFSLFRGDRVVRIPEYENSAPVEPELLVFVLVPAQARGVIRELSAQGYLYRATPVGRYVVLDQIRPGYPRGSQIPLRAEQIEVPSRSEQRSNMVDRKEGTRWGSGLPQRNGMTIDLKFDPPMVVSGVDLDSGLWPQDIARALSVEVEGIDGSRCLIASGVMTPSAEWNRAEYGTYRYRFAFPSRTVKSIRLIQEGSDPVFDWSIAEVAVYGDPDATPSGGAATNSDFSQ